MILVLVLVIVITFICFSYSISIVYYNTFNLVLFLVSSSCSFSCCRKSRSTGAEEAGHYVEKHTQLGLRKLDTIFQKTHSTRAEEAGHYVEKHTQLGLRKLDTKN